MVNWAPSPQESTVPDDNSAVARFRRSPTVEQARQLDEWTLLHGRFQGREIAVRRNSMMDRVRNRRAHPIQVGVSIGLLAPDSRGFASAIENERLLEIEDQIEHVVGSRGVFVAALTTAGVRELLFYSASLAWVADFQDELTDTIEGRPVRVMAKDDPSWSAYFMFRDVSHTDR